MKKCLTILILAIVFNSCDRIKYPTGNYSETPINLDFLNSPYDDINSNTHFLGYGIEFVFSTNRPNPHSNDFRLLTYNIDISWDRKDGILSVKEVSSYAERPNFLTLKRMAESTITNNNEKGPYSFNETNDNLALFFSRDMEGIYSINVVTEKPAPSLNNRTLSNFRILDESSNEMYPCFFGKEFMKGDVNGDGTPEKMLFSSDKGGQFDIYEVDIPEGMTPLEFLADNAPKEVRQLAINTSANDHMPFVLGDKLVFASDRPGGMGGYDLYYSKRTPDGWSSPINFGHPINSEFDEYRPIVSGSDWFLNNLMIFSSNRPGGKGGFDLYYVGVSK